MTLIHGPESMSDVFGAGRRLVFDELLRVQLTLLRRKRALELACVGVQHRIEGELVDRFRSALGFELTAAQQRTMDEIDFDLSSATPMHRLLQGDVGSGKTLVAVHAMVVAVQGGHQAALMAPTEVLAEHTRSASESCCPRSRFPTTERLRDGGPLRCRLLTNRVEPRRDGRFSPGSLLARSTSSSVLTHSSRMVSSSHLSAPSWSMNSTDSVSNRGINFAIRDGRTVAFPTLLVMTATPIPRTAAMTVYGDLDVSVLDELPPGRTPIITHRVEDDVGLSEMWHTVREEIADGGRSMWSVL